MVKENLALVALVEPVPVIERLSAVVVLITIFKTTTFAAQWLESVGGKKG